jgi:hypothetical protein
MRFETWLKEQRDRDDWIGDLACDYLRTRKRTIAESMNGYAVCEEAKQALKQARLEYKVFLEFDTAKFNT